MIYLELDNVTFQSPKMNPLDRVVKKTQNQIGLFAKLRSLPKIKLGYLRNCENRNFTNCESYENCESQFAKVAKIANICLKNQTEKNFCRKFNCVICEIALPFQNQIGLFAKLRFLRNRNSQFRNYRNFRNPFYNSAPRMNEPFLYILKHV